MKGDMPPVLWVGTNSQSGRFDAHRHKLYDDDSRYLLGSQADESYTDALRDAAKREQSAAASMRSACVEIVRKEIEALSRTSIAAEQNAGELRLLHALHNKLELLTLQEQEAKQS